MIPAPLMDAIAAETAALSDLAGSFLSLDPAALLRRGRPLTTPGRVSANGSARLVRVRDGWLAINLARPEDVASIPAWIEESFPADAPDDLAALLADRTAAPLLRQARLLGLPVAQVGEARPSPPPRLALAPATNRPPLVVDLSALWAGPLCAGLLAQAGLPVLRLESARRPDPTPRADPALDAALNGLKQRQTVDLAADRLAGLIADARILVTSGRPHALARLGLTPECLFARNPALLWVAVTAHGWSGEAGLRVGFGDDCAAAGGLVRWEAGAPHFIGDALADPLTGLHAAGLALDALAQGRAGLLDVSLAGTAALFAKRAGLS